MDQMKKGLHIAPGNTVVYQGAKIIIRQLLDLNTVLAENAQTKKSLRAPIKDLISENEAASKNENTDSLLSYTQEQWDEANKKYNLIKKALENPGDGTIVDDISESSGKSKATIYRWIDKYQKAQTIVSLIEGRGQKNKGVSKLDSEIEEIIKEGIEKVYLKKGERKKITKVIEYVQGRCKRLQLSAPHVNSIRNRIKQLNEFKVVKARYGLKAARQNFDPNYGNFEVETALSVVQIDHTPVDLILVDPIYRKPIGKPWITTALDVKTRMVLGYYLSFSPPNFMAVGLCLSSAILPKEKILVALSIDGSWPCWGFMSNLHSDNAKEFRSKSLERACQFYHINSDFRPLGKPNWGGHIESFQKTLNQEIHNLPGTTFSNTEERGDYPSEKKAALTFENFERWLILFIVNVYHQRMHSQIMTSPINAWENEIIGTEGRPGIGVQPIPDEQRLKIDFMPVFHRTVQEYGVAHESINYYSPVLKNWVHKMDRTSGKANTMKKHEFRWDPRDMSSIYFFDEEANQYYQVPYRNLKYPSINIWELRAIKKHLKEIGEKNIDEDKIFSALEEMNRIEENAINEKKKIEATKRRERKKNSEKKVTNSPITSPTSKIFDEIDIDDLKPY